ncbi:MAG: tetratricopeptide repeat protein [Bradymonadia bacterium]
MAERNSSPTYRLQQSLPIHVIIPPELAKVKGIKRYIHQQFALTTDRLKPLFGLQTHPVFTPQTIRSLRLTLTVNTPRQVVDYGAFAINLPLTVGQIAEKNGNHLAKELSPSILLALGLPLPCVSGEVITKDNAFLSIVVEQHLVRRVNSLQITPISLMEVSKMVLRGIKNHPSTPSCFQSLIGLERLHLWEDMTVNVHAMDEPAEGFLSEAYVALSKGDAKTAYQLCAAVAESRPQTGAARCAAKAADSLGKQTEAIRMWRAHLAFFPDDRDGLLGLARMTGRQGDDDGARALLQQSVARFPEWIDAKIDLGIALYRLNQTEKARALWREVLVIDPTNEDVQQLLRQY